MKAETRVYVHSGPDSHLDTTVCPVLQHLSHTIGETEIDRDGLSDTHIWNASCGLITTSLTNFDVTVKGKRGHIQNKTKNRTCLWLLSI